MMHYSDGNTYAQTRTLTKREKEIVLLMCMGLTSKEIGKELYISSLTVDKHKSNLIAKYNARNGCQLIYKLITCKAINPAEINQKTQELLLNTYHSES